MSAHCNHHHHHDHDHDHGTSSASPGFRRALWIALVVNAAMFVVELGASWQSGSVSLMAGKDDGRVALLFKTHPHPDDRLAKLGDAIGDRLDKVDGKTLENRLYKLKD